MNNRSLDDFYKKGALRVLEELGVGERGLSDGEAKRRLLKYGPNKLPETKADGILKIFFRQFQNPLIFILLLATGVVFATGEKMDGFVILFVLFFNSVVGTIQEGKAQNIFSALKNFTKTDAVVLRDGTEHIVSDEEVVPGDIIIVREGGKVPADARLLASDSLQVNESALTGESNPKFKIPDLIKEDLSVADQRNMVFRGTGIVTGTGKAVVTATGPDTFIGKIAEKMSSIDEDLPLKANISRFSRLVIIAVICISFLILLAGILYGHGLREIFSTIVAVSVSVIPEGLPIVVTLVLATGVWRMGKQNVLVKRLQAVEALGQIDIIAVDKTGTVTKNELVVREVYVGNRIFSVEGAGYDPSGTISCGGKSVDPLNHPELLMVGKIAALCSNSSLAFDDNLKQWKISGDPTEAATLVFAKKIGFNKDRLKKEFQKIDEKPFEYDLRYHALLSRQNGKSVLFVVGAPEEILSFSERVRHETKSSFISPISPSERKRLEGIISDMSKRGLRVVALGMKNSTEGNVVPDKLSSLDFVGFFGIEDSPRDEVKDAVSRVKSAGIKLVMITGDHEITAKAIAEKTGIFDGGEIISGRVIDAMTEKKLSAKLENINVFARVSPAHKLKIINAYKKAGYTVAMTGDGVNDALSLTSADVGVAMGKIGTEVAREASDIVLLDDNFGNIVSGVEEGRNIYKTIKRVILYLFSTSIGEVLTILGAIILGFPLPILAAQILWLNLVTDGFLDVALAMEPKKNGLLGKNFSKQTGLLDKVMAKRMLLMSFPMAAGTLFLFSQYQNDLSKGWTVSLTTLAVFQWFNAWNCRSESKSIFSMNPFSNKFLVGATIIVVGLQFLAVYNSFFQKILHTVPLNPREWVVIILVAFSIIALEETRKVFERKRNQRLNILKHK